MTVRAKFRVDSVTDTEIKMTAVTSQTKQFHQGEEFYLTFDKA